MTKTRILVILLLFTVQLFWDACREPERFPKKVKSKQESMKGANAKDTVQNILFFGNSLTAGYGVNPEDTLVRNSIIENSIIGSYSRLEIAVLNGSIIGSDTILKGPSQSLNIGDNTEINYSSND